MRLRMQVKRHPEDAEVQERFKRMVAESREMRNKLVHGECTEDEYFGWLNQFE